MQTEPAERVTADSKSERSRRISCFLSIYQSYGHRPLCGLSTLILRFPGFAALTPGFTPSSAPRTFQSFL